MRWACVLVATTATACGGRDAAFPRERPTVRVVGCSPALPAPTLATELFGELSDGVAVATLARPRITIGDITVTSGAIDVRQVRNILATRLSELQDCYMREGTGALTARSVSLTLGLSPSGRVYYVREYADGRGSSPACIQRMLTQSPFPSSASNVMLNIALQFGAKDADAPARAQPAVAPAPWTPFALDDLAPGDDAERLARGTEHELQGRLAAYERCFAATSPTGSLRLMLALDDRGALTGARVGGLGDAAIEACVHQATSGLRVRTPTSSAVEVACDVSRGDAEPWRIAPAGYQVITTSRAKLAHGARTLSIGAPAPAPLTADGAFLIVAEPDTRGSILSLALSWAHDSQATLVTLRDRRDAPPRFVALGKNAASEPTDDAADVISPALRLGSKSLTACVNRTTQTARLAKPELVRALLANVATKCQSLACAQTLVIALDPDASMTDLVEVTAVARRTGFARILVGGERCGAPLATPASDEPDQLELEEAP